MSSSHFSELLPNLLLLPSISQEKSAAAICTPLVQISPGHNSLNSLHITSFLRLGPMYLSYSLYLYAMKTMLHLFPIAINGLLLKCRGLRILLSPSHEQSSFCRFLYFFVIQHCNEYVSVFNKPWTSTCFIAFLMASGRGAVFPTQVEHP